MVNRAAAARALWPILAAMAIVLDGCALWRLRKDVKQLDQMGLLGGRVAQAHDDRAPIVVALTTGVPAVVADAFVLEGPGSYFFVVPEGTYRVAAFVDPNRDFAYQPGEEPAAYHGAPAEVRVAAGQKVGGIDVSIPAESSARLDVPISVPDPGTRGIRELPAVHVGDLVTLDDPRFSAKSGKLGLWQPVEFLFEVGAGFYFLERFDPEKIPVLFVHGSGGTPRDWRYLIEHLDRTAFQPWLLYYPSGLRLEATARGAARWLTTLSVRHEVERVLVVAHSMGGLVSRAMINELVAKGVATLPAAFISISTPWNGYAAAASGVKESPVVMPMWIDMAPGSPFLAEIFRTALPPDCPHYLLFSYSGHSRLLREPNDGVVALSSELALPAQHNAERVYGFKESHVSILRSGEVSATLNALLAKAAP